MNDVAPALRAKASHGWKYHNLSAFQQPPRRQPAIAIVEVNIAADEKYALNQGQLGGMVKPRAAVQERYAAHPVRMVVEYHEIERLSQAAQQSQAHVMKISGAIESRPRLVV